jgi:hypothetical protein
MTQIVVWLNSTASLLGGWLLAPIAWLPGWASITLVSAATGVVLLLAFKFTSNQRAISHVRSQIQADLLAILLFNDNLVVALKSQGRLLVNAARLLALSLVPMLVMTAPVVLLLGQLSVWYEARPLAIGEEFVVTMSLSGTDDDAWPDIQMEESAACETQAGPVRIRSQRQIVWRIRPREAGYSRLIFDVGGARVDKELAVGNGFLRTSPLRPSWNWSDSLLYPWESPFPDSSPVKSIAVDYPQRTARAYGSKSWVYSWFVVSMVAAFACRRPLNVKL